MKTKFFLALFALNGLLLSATSVSAATGSTPITDRSITNLSQTISTLIDFDDRSLVEQAINRALIAQNVRNPRTGSSGTPNNIPAGGISADPSQVKPIINGKVAQPSRPFVNGRIQNPQADPSPNPKPIINGIIVNPNSR
ncbi:hypothetical protein [Chamaesiphon sp. VAR_48_metabat_403]|uniref:hypothetical protein n=1 Tax=Chamaesiphon sp. VAR_48_metabat_403 TaxID=2964700 RepID=UPI00286E269A|nr:hypothetical protein [Chamaesiphon sp. VAR_48_metabat_403]